MKTLGRTTLRLVAGALALAVGSGAFAHGHGHGHDHGRGDWNHGHRDWSHGRDHGDGRGWSHGRGHGGGRGWAAVPPPRWVAPVPVAPRGWVGYGAPVVVPRPGMFVNALPALAAAVLLGGITYYVANGVYYAPAPGGYTVVAPPPAVTYGHPSDPYGYTGY